MRFTFLLLCACLCSLAGNGWQLYLAGGAKPRCQTELAGEVNQQAGTAQADQQAADQEHIRQLSAEIVELQQDAVNDADERAALGARYQRQEGVLKHVYDTDSLARVCLAARVPRALLDSLHAGDPAGTEPRGGGDPLRGEAHR